METEKQTTQTRRMFFGSLAIRIAGIGAVAAALRRFGFAAQDKPDTVLASVKIADNPDLAKVGGFVLIKDTPEGEVLVVRAGEDEFDAMSNVCPHKQCHVEVKSPTVIKCPCHGSTYKIDGTYVSGPAKRSLKKFRATVEGGVITVTAG